MTKEQYTEELKRITDKFEFQKRELAKTFAFANNTVKIGDVVSDGTKTVKVDKIMYCTKSARTPFPCCVYNGYELTKKGEIRKDKSIGTIYQPNLKP